MVLKASGITYYCPPHRKKESSSSSLLLHQEIPSSLLPAQHFFYDGHSCWEQKGKGVSAVVEMKEEEKEDLTAAAGWTHPPPSPTMDH